jgi:hypothetical protein
MYPTKKSAARRETLSAIKKAIRLSNKYPRIREDNDHCPSITVFTGRLIRSLG